MRLDLESLKQVAEDAIEDLSSKDARTVYQNVFHPIITQALIERVEFLEASLRELADYQFSINDSTGKLVKFHCLSALEK